MLQFSVTQVRQAATCPRILYFDFAGARAKGLKRPRTVTRIWKGGENIQPAGGKLFHNAIEGFNSQALADPQLRALLAQAEGPVPIAQGLGQIVFTRFVNHGTLRGFKGEQQQAFIAALRTYLEELAQVIAFLLNEQKMPMETVLEHLFGHNQRGVQVDFDFAPTPVRVKGILDYMFYDPRHNRQRILDYKLTPADTPANDLFQVCVYALLHHRQFDTKPSAAVLYLYPQRKMFERSWNEIMQQQDTLLDLFASMAAWIEYDAPSGEGMKPPGRAEYCAMCKWSEMCTDTLGPVAEGAWRQWQEAVQTGEQERLPAQAPLQPPKKSDHAKPEANPPAHALWLGHLEHEGQVVGVPPDILRTHTAIVGAAGSGKTWLAKVFTEEVILQGVPVIAIDPQGDLVQFIRAQSAAGMDAAEQARHERYWQTVEARIFTPGSSHARRLSLNPLHLANSAELANIPSPERRQEEADGMFDATAANLVALAKAGGESDSQQAFMFQLLKRLAGYKGHTRLQLADVVAGIQDPEAFGMEDVDLLVKKNEREKLGRKLNAVLHGPGAKLFSGGTPLDLEALRKPDTPGKVPLNVIYLNALSDDAQKQFFVATLAGEIYRWMVTSLDGGDGQNNLLFYIDEARDYIPTGGKSPPAKQPLIRLFTQGRKYGLGCLLCTQSPRSVDYNVFGNCSTKLIGRLESAQDSARVGEWFATSGAVPVWVKQRNGAKPGSFVGRWPGIPPEFEGAVLFSRKLFSCHEGAWPPSKVEEEAATADA